MKDSARMRVPFVFAALAILGAAAAAADGPKPIGGSGAAPGEIIFRVRLVLGSDAGTEPTDAALKNDPVVKELENLLKLKAFTLLDAKELRAKEGEASVLVLGRGGEYVFSVAPRIVKKDGSRRIEADIKFGYAFSGEPRLELISSRLILTPGEPTVVGVSKTPAPGRLPNPERGLILIITGSIGT